MGWRNSYLDGFTELERTLQSKLPSPLHANASKVRVIKTCIT